MKIRITRLAGRAIVAAVAAAAALATQIDPARAAPAGRPHQERQPVLTLTGTGTWAIRDGVGDAVVNGSGQLQPRNPNRTKDVLVAATVDADDGTLPGPGECETAIATMSAYGSRGVDFTMIGAGDVCGVHPQSPTSIVTHVFTGTYEIYDTTSRPHRFVGTDGFFEIRLADNGTASVFAIDS